MSARTEERRIGNYNYTVTQFLATDALGHLADLAKLAGPAMVMMGDSSEATTLEEAKEEVGEKLSAAIGALMAGLDKQTHVKLIKDLLEKTRVDNAPLVFDTHFMGRIGHLFKVLLFVLEVNFSDFLEEIGVLLAAQQPAKVSDHSMTESQSTGTYGD